MAEPIDRRHFIEQTGKAALAAAAFGATYFALDARPDFPSQDTAKQARADYRREDSSLIGKLAIAEGDDPRDLARRTLGALGGMENRLGSHTRASRQHQSGVDGGVGQPCSCRRRRRGDCDRFALS